MDSTGNEEEVKTVTIPVDTVPPMSTIVVSPAAPAGGWYSDNVTITLIVTDDLSGWVGDTWHRIDGAEFQQGAEAVITGEGSHSFEYYSADVAGNLEAPHNVGAICRIDRESPTVNATPDKEGEYVQPPVSISLAAQDTLSGIQVVQYRRQSESTWQEGTEIQVDGSQGDGIYTYAYRALDNAGNASATGIVTVTIDGTNPGVPADLVVAPDDWVNENGLFSLSWSNPPDLSGIAGAYYQLDVDPTDTLSPTYYVGDDLQEIEGLSVPSEGKHTAYVWLQDGVGNSDPWSRQELVEALRYDATLPTCSARATGPIGEDTDYFAGPITVTLTGQDSLSGIRSFRYRVEQGAWITETVAGSPLEATHDLALSQEGRTTVEYLSTDSAGNACSGSLTVRVDSTPPSSPLNLAASPAGWTQTNGFGVCWVPEDNYSGAGTVYYKRDDPPESESDFDHAQGLTLGQTCLSGITVDQERETPLYVWLKDRAGNVDHTTARSVSLRYDVSAPQTVIEPPGSPVSYYTAPVALQFNAIDNVSGITQTAYTIDDGAVQTWQGLDVMLDQEGNHIVEYWSVDRAGNEERPHRQALYRIDLYKPTSKLRVSSDYSNSGSVLVDWTGYETSAGSGIERYTLQYRQGGCSPWQTWHASTASTSDTFTGMKGNSFYSFRARAEDRAGHVSEWSNSPRSDYTYEEGLWGLESWIRDGELGSSMVYTQTHAGDWDQMARLSKQWPVEDVPVDTYGSIWQSIQLPQVACDSGLLLSFWYDIVGYDAVHPAHGVWSDPFEVFIRDSSGTELAQVVYDGNSEWIDLYYVYDVGWKHRIVDLTQWAGQQIRIEFRMSNLFDQYFPTWAYVDDVRLFPSPGRLLHLPLVTGSAVGVSSEALKPRRQAPKSRAEMIRGLAERRAREEH